MSLALLSTELVRSVRDELGARQAHDWFVSLFENLFNPAFLDETYGPGVAKEHWDARRAASCALSYITSRIRPEFEGKVIEWTNLIAKPDNTDMLLCGTAMAAIIGQDERRLATGLVHYWCRTHKRPATFFDQPKLKWRCDPTLGGIMLPCNVVAIPDVQPYDREPFPELP